MIEGEKMTFEEILEKSGYLAYTTVGRSMLPLLRERRDIVVIRAKEGGRFRKYDVVLYKRGPKYILHRIVEVLPEGYAILGDHNIQKEYDITDAHILGVMTKLIRNGKEITPDNRRYRLYVRFWCGLYPARAAYFRCRAFAGRTARKLLGPFLKKSKRR